VGVGVCLLLLCTKQTKQTCSQAKKTKNHTREDRFESRVRASVCFWLQQKPGGVFRFVSYAPFTPKGKQKQLFSPDQ
jgi:hypothetical protein